MATQTSSRQNNLAGIMTMCGGVAALCINDALAKGLMDHYSPIQIIFLRNIIALPFAFLVALKMGGSRSLRSNRVHVHFMRGVVWIAATVMFFTSIHHLGLAEATALAFVAPLFITALSAIFIARVGWRRWLAVSVGFVGVLVIVRPGAATFELISLLPIATAFTYAILMLSARFVDTRESMWTLLLYLSLTSAILTSIPVIFVWSPVRAEDIWLFLAIALCGSLGMAMITQAFRFAEAPTVAPFDYTALIWATALGWMFWGETPDVLTFVGAAIITASGLFVIFRESKVAAETT
ncbi:DMT family transporter [Thalassospira tepidiphila]|uniref:Membrane protein n=2 Tax=Thalassospira tepidiphila TaxID=393657 RepID=A0A853KYK0_9PROT|nr:DMT family transporter [Thalassospira tepidiphila]NJB75824.1 drug/metabolite transporter (DMT)-like permease [Thalassospira tepidiphila]OAZ08865.1 membrane protein [Thalassospira tepidiphila MCCC 1A03514]